MPEIKRPTLLVVCDSHKCRLIDVGGRTLLEKEILESKEEKFTDRRDTVRGPSGIMSGVGDLNQADLHRLKDFANAVSKHIDQSLRTQKIGEMYLAAPGKFLSILTDHLSVAAKKVLCKKIEGNFIKEPSTEILLRFIPELKTAVESLRDQENYSTRKHLPKKSKK
jgi:protein required for attachment to host cells